MASGTINYENNPFFEKEIQTASPGKKILNFLQIFVVFLFVLIFIYLFLATPNQVTGNSMWPTFHDKEVVLTYRLVGVLGNTSIGQALGLGYRHGDVIILQKPGFDEFIKRVIGTPGDRVKVQDKHVYLNGALLDEPYLGSFVKTNAGDLLTEGKEITVPEGNVLVMGDNRPGSYDSRFQGIGLIKMEWIKGRVLIRLTPLSKFGIIQHANYVYTFDPADAKGAPTNE